MKLCPLIAKNSYVKSLLILAILLLISSFGFTLAYGYGGSDLLVLTGSVNSLPPAITAINVPLEVNPTQTGRLSQEVGSNRIELKVPKGAVKGLTEFEVNTAAPNPNNKPSISGAQLVSERIFIINAQDIEESPVKSFFQPITITLIIPDLPANTSDLGVYYFSPSQQSWILVPEANFDPTNHKVEFTINHLTRFAVWQVPDRPAELPIGAKAGVTQGAESQPELTQTQLEKINISNDYLFKHLAGRIILRVQAHGEAYYVNPSDKKAYYLGRPSDAFAIMRQAGIGITNANLAKIPLGLAKVSGADADGDGLSDLLEDALGTNKNLADSDGDGYNDKEEILNNHNPLGAGDLLINSQFAQAQAGKIFLQVQAHGEAWYVNPADGKRYFLGRPSDAFAIMRQAGLGISEIDFAQL